MIRRFGPVLLATAAAVLLLTACGDVAGGDADDAGTGSPDVTGSWGDTEAENAPFLEFTADGRVSGTDGCNRLFGGWSIQGTRITLTDMASTKMYCHDVDEWLSAGAAADVDGDTLRILDSSGAEIGVLER